MTGFDSKRQAAQGNVAQPEQEPVAIRYDFDGCGWQYIDNGHGSNWRERVTHLDAENLYTTPPKRKPLSDKEIYSLADSLEIWNEDDEEWILDPNTFARAIEAAYGIKG